MGQPMNNSGPLQYGEWRGLCSLLAGRTVAHLSVSHSLDAGSWPTGFKCRVNTLRHYR